MLVKSIMLYSIRLCSPQFPFLTLSFFFAADLRARRGGCIVCMDYSYYAQQSYYKLVSRFDGIADALTGALGEFWQTGIEPANTFLFGFSFGARLALEAGRRVGEHRIQQIDGLCSVFEFKTINIT